MATGQVELPEGSALHLRHTGGEPIGRIAVTIAEDGMRLAAAPQGASAAGLEPDTSDPPGSAPGQRLWLSPGDTDTFHLAHNGQRYFAFRVTEDHPPLRLGTSAEEDADWQICLSTLVEGEDVCRGGAGEALFANMQLPPDDYSINVRRTGGSRSEPVALTLSLSEDVALPEGWLDRPADSRAWAFPLAANETVQGRFESSREAWFDLRVAGETQQWRLSAKSEVPLSRLSLYRAGENVPFVDLSQARQNPQPLLVDNLRLLPGDYRVRLTGAQTDFSLVASPQGEPQPGMEMEPNDRDENANPLWLGESVRGTFHNNADQDRFHFHLPGWSRVVMELEPPQDGAMSASLLWHGSTRLALPEADGPTATSQILPPGDYVLILSGRQSPNTYQATLSVASPWTVTGRVAPSPLKEWAPLLPEGGLVTSDLGGGRGYLRLPVTDEDREIELLGRIGVLAGDTVIVLVTDQGELIETERHNTGRRTAIIPAGQAVWLDVRFGNRSPDVQITDPAYPLPEGPQLLLELEVSTELLAAFSENGQQVSSRLILDNPEPYVQHVTLEGYVNYTGGAVVGLPEEITLEPGERTELLVDWTLPPDLLESAPVVLSAKVGENTVEYQLRSQRHTPPVDPFIVPDIPPTLAGMTNLAWSALGATFVDADSGEALEGLPQQSTSYAHFLLDDMASGTNSIEVHSHGNRAFPPGEALPPIRLAGEGGLIHGLAFNQRSSRTPLSSWREIEVALGESLDDLEVIMTVELASTDGEQYFLLDQPRRAAYLQLRPLSSWDQPVSVRHAGTGVLRVLGEPTGELGERRHNLLDRELGGHWVYTLPDLSSLRGLQGERIDYRAVMNEGATRLGEPIRNRTIQMVFAFQQQRAARIAGLQWRDDLSWQGAPIERVRVYTATESPVGPWHEQADWALARDEDGVASLGLDTSPWARYIRLVFDEPEADPENRSPRWRIPAALSVFEADSLGSGRSVLGYWGLDHSRGPFEAEQPSQDRSVDQVEDVDSHRDAPWELRQQVTGRVREPGDTRHYRVEMGEGNNAFSFALRESQRGRVQVTLRDPEGQDVSLTWQDTENGQRVAEAVGLEPGEYRLQVAEPPRSVVFIWDGSGSVASHQPAIYQALNGFAEGLEPGREVFNMMPLGGPLLINGWAESPIQVTETLAAYDNRFESSDSEPALQTAIRALERQQGERAIFLITDAEQVDRDLSVWNDLARVRPRIFSLEISHGERVAAEANRWRQQQMMSWAHVGNGHYRYTTDRSGLLRAFEEGMQMLRQPTDFSLEVHSRYQEPPAPGRLTVVSVEGRPAIAAGAVHLIFDASGSMLRQMEGGRRIDVARRIVQRVLDEYIPDDVPVGLRAFGHTEPHSCTTELLIAPSANNHAEVRRMVGDIQAINLARTALADSLNAVVGDLAEYADQRRLVVMLTDGEETCEGDLEQSVVALVDEGINVRLDIVGFHIDEPGLRLEFERLAELGGGAYFESRDGDELVAGLSGALAADWRVLDLNGDVMGRGRVDGESVELHPGEYELVIDTREGEYRRAFEMTPRAEVQLEMEAGS